jgi:hypothetical protein
MYRRKTLQGKAKEVGIGETAAAQSPEGKAAGVGTGKTGPQKKVILRKVLLLW